MMGKLALYRYYFNEIKFIFIFLFVSVVLAILHLGQNFGFDENLVPATLFTFGFGFFIFASIREFMIYRSAMRKRKIYSTHPQIDILIPSEARFLFLGNIFYGLWTVIIYFFPLRTNIMA